MTRWAVWAAALTIVVVSVDAFASEYLPAPSPAARASQAHDLYIFQKNGRLEKIETCDAC